MVRTYYRGPAGIVTETHFVRVCDGRAFLLSELHQVGTTRRRGTYYVPIVVVTALAVLAGVLVGLVVGQRWAWVVGGAVAGVALIAGRVLLARNRVTHTLQAVYRGAEAELYSTTDASGFAQVCRAMRRALENR
ncbi:DUF6232 family protein [Paractinoplanes maris]|uniref:DUF6232 family protein n=1 Tax=Paractinoplanes maris TaxID=1734446 RepID=UPI002022762B|nr:DUF6232 family protein [Actinoplanes maris]